MPKRKKLYHGSPHKLDEIRPATATGKGEASAREHAIYLANNPEEARLYALTRPRNNKRKGWAILDNKVHYVKGDPINKQGYVYEHEFDDYEAPPESDPGIGYRVYGAYKPTKRKRVRLKGMEDRFVEHPDKASYKAKVKEWLATREKTSSVRHTLVAGHSGAGKTTLAKRLSEQSGLPIYELDKDPDIVEQLERQKAYIKAGGGLDRGATARLPTGPEWDIPFQRASKAGINRALALKTPHVIEGTYLLDRDPKLLRDHELHLVDTPEDIVLDRRVERQRLKDIARGRYWGDDRAAGVRLRGQQLIDENKQGAARWRKADYVKKAAVRSQEVMRDTDKVMRHASTMKLASKRFRHRATLLLQDDQGRIFAKKESPERVAKGVSRVNLPGGGVHEDELETRAPTKREIIRAARKEALEELGMRIRSPRLLGSHSGELDDWWKDQQEKKRGVRFDGAAEHFILAKPSRKDMSLYNVEGDAFKGQYYDLKDLDPLVAQDAKRDSAFAQFNRKQLELMRGLQKKASKEVRVGRKVYRPKVQAFMYDDQGRILAAKSQASGSGLRAFDNYKFPGGGIEAGEDVAEAARKELLEEAGYEADGDMFEFGTPTAVDWDKKFRRQARKKGRGRFAGQYEYYAAGRIGKRNTSLLGSEGDALGGMEFVPMSKLQRDLTRTANDTKNEYNYFDKQKLVALKQLETELKNRGVKVASFTGRLRNVELPREFGSITDRYYQAYGQGKVIDYGNSRYRDYRKPQTKRERRMENMYGIKTAEKSKRRMSHVDPDKYNDNFRLGQMIGTGAAGMSLGAALGGLRPEGTNRQALAGALLGAGTGALLGNKLYRRKSDAVVYNATKRTPRHRVKDSLLADIENVDPALLRAPNNHFMTEDELKKTAQKGVATKTDPAKWARAKAQARAKMGGKHSARAMQLATQIYKKSGGGYSGKKPSSGTNKLKKWTKQKWQWSGKDKPGQGGTGVYLPKRSSEQLKSTRAGRDKLRAASAAKRAATASGRQFSSHGLHVGKKRSDVR